MSAALHHQRCFRHAAREAVARCGECRRFFCRECITEHDDRLICAACLKTLTAAAQPRRRSWALLGQLTASFAGLVLTFIFFHTLAGLLIKIPSNFHAGTIWKTNWWESP